MFSVRVNSLCADQCKRNRECQPARHINGNRYEHSGNCVMRKAHFECLSKWVCNPYSESASSYRRIYILPFGLPVAIFLASSASCLSYCRLSTLNWLNM